MLMQIFDRKGKRSNINVLLAGLKLMELFTLFQLEEFYFYQWIFVFDCIFVFVIYRFRNDYRDEA